MLQSFIAGVAFISPALEIGHMGIVRASARLLVMAGVMAAVLTVAIIAGVGATTAIAGGVVLAGSVGLVMVSRRPTTTSAAAEIAAMMAPPVAALPAVPLAQATAVEAMAPPSSQPIDPEAGMPRWRRPSLLEARRADPTLQAPARHTSRRFTDNDAAGLDVRVVRYAIVPVLDRPDEVLGLRLSDLEQGDEVGVVGAAGAYLEITCPNGDRGWVHRTTLGPKLADAPAFRAAPPDTDDALTTLLQARGLS